MDTVELIARDGSMIAPGTRRWVAFVFGWLVGLGPAGAQTPAVRWVPELQPAAVEVIGVPATRLRELAGRGPGDPVWSPLFSVFAEQPAAAGSVPPMAGEWRIAGDRLRFEPRFPLARGVRYRAEYTPAGAPPLVSYFALPADSAPASTTVVQVFPSAEELPENQLKFYVHFSAPMSRGDTYEHIRIRDAAGNAVELAFLELDEELWDPTMTRLTLLIDPGRIKRGVRPLEEVGPVFEAGKAYCLTIGANCRDAAGRPLLAGFQKRIQVRPADRTPPDPARWKITSPAAGTAEALVVDFDEPMDSALALRLIRVTNGEARAIGGESSLAAEERRWRFVPDTGWERGLHRLVVATIIEDLAGNNIGKAFDVDQFERVHRTLATERVTMEFTVR